MVIYGTHMEHSHDFLSHQKVENATYYAQGKISLLTEEITKAQQS